MEFLDFMEKRIDGCLLLSFYGTLLTARQQELLAYYYEEDYSLSEIAELCSVTRQGAHDAIQRGERQLMQLEAQLGMVARWQHTQDALRTCRAAIREGDMEGALKTIEDLLLTEAQDGI